MTEQEAQTPILDVLVESALKKFRSKHTGVDGGEYYPYHSSAAAKDAVGEVDISSNELYSTLTRQTSFTPVELELDFDIDAETWEEFEIRIANRVISKELLKRHPEIIPENEGRSDWTSNSYKRRNQY